MKQCVALCCIFMISIVNVGAEESLEDIKHETDMIKARTDRLRAKQEFEKIKNPAATPPSVNIDVISATYTYNPYTCDASKLVIAECQGERTCRINVSDSTCKNIGKSILKVEFYCGKAVTGTEPNVISVPEGQEAILACK